MFILFETKRGCTADAETDDCLQIGDGQMSLDDGTKEEIGRYLLPLRAFTKVENILSQQNYRVEFFKVNYSEIP